MCGHASRRIAYELAAHRQAADLDKTARLHVSWSPDGKDRTLLGRAAGETTRGMPEKKP